MADAKALAEKIEKKVDDLLSPLDLEMISNKWPAQFRAIMWDAVADKAARLAAHEHQSARKGE